MEFVSLVLLHK